VRDGNPPYPARRRQPCPAESRIRLSGNAAAAKIARMRELSAQLVAALGSPGNHDREVYAALELALQAFRATTIRVPRPVSGQAASGAAASRKAFTDRHPFCADHKGGGWLPARGAWSPAPLRACPTTWRVGRTLLTCLPETARRRTAR